MTGGRNASARKDNCHSFEVEKALGLSTGTTFATLLKRSVCCKCKIKNILVEVRWRKPTFHQSEGSGEFFVHRSDKLLQQRLLISKSCAYSAMLHIDRVSQCAFGQLTVKRRPGKCCFALTSYYSCFLSLNLFAKQFDFLLRKLTQFFEQLLLVAS